MLHNPLLLLCSNFYSSCPLFYLVKTFPLLSSIFFNAAALCCSYSNLLYFCFLLFLFFLAISVLIRSSLFLLKLQCCLLFLFFLQLLQQHISVKSSNPSYFVLVITLLLSSVPLCSSFLLKISFMILGMKREKMKRPTEKKTLKEMS